MRLANASTSNLHTEVLIKDDLKRTKKNLDQSQGDDRYLDVDSPIQNRVCIWKTHKHQRHIYYRKKETCRKGDNCWYESANQGIIASM